MRIGKMCDYAVPIHILDCAEYKIAPDVVSLSKAYQRQKMICNKYEPCAYIRDFSAKGWLIFDI